MLNQFQNIPAGVHPGTEVIVLRPPANLPDRDETFKKSWDTSRAQPHGLAKSSEVERESFDPRTIATRAEGENAVVEMIRKAHSAPGSVESLEAGYSGRAASLSKGLMSHVAADERGEIFTEDGRQLVRISKVL